ncbi:MAG: cbb3-type cytochrome oxidase assembly protein CcoS [Maribacter sp.]|nr:cbb3-type cytochrome oxidase assembly protein CcoS [Maribacter sp.]
MSVISVLLTISIIVAVVFFIAFIVSVRSGQFDDSYTPSVRMLFEDELVKPASPVVREHSSNSLENENKSIQLNKSQKL